MFSLVLCYCLCGGVSYEKIQEATKDQMDCKENQESGKAMSYTDRVFQRMFETAEIEIPSDKEKCIQPSAYKNLVTNGKEKVCNKPADITFLTEEKKYSYCIDCFRTVVLHYGLEKRFKVGQTILILE